MDGKVYNAGQLDLLLFQGKQACLRAGYSPEFVDGAYDQITDAINAADASRVEAAELDKLEKDIFGDDVDDREPDVVSDEDIEIVMGILEETGQTVPDFATIELAERLEDALLDYGSTLVPSDPGEDAEDAVKMGRDLRAISRVMKSNREQLLAEFSKAASKILSGCDVLVAGLEDLSVTFGGETV